MEITNQPSLEDTKKPQDHKVKENPDGSKTVKVNGVKVTVNADVLNDFEFLDQLDDMDSGKPGRAPKVLRHILGDDQYGKVMDKLREPETGRVPIDAGVMFIQNLFRELSPNS